MRSVFVFPRAEIDRTLQAAMGELPWWSVTGDVTGRIDGGPQVRAFVLALLADGGVAMDDDSDHCWTAEEIAGDVRRRACVLARMGIKLRHAGANTYLLELGCPSVRRRAMPDSGLRAAQR